jgi:hypothetical protein
MLHESQSVFSQNLLARYRRGSLLKGYQDLTRKSRTMASLTTPNTSFNVVSISQWWNDTCTESATEGQRLPLLDVRTRKDYEQQRIQHSSIMVVQSPLEFLRARSFELPARHVNFSLLVDDAGSLEEAQTFLLGPKDSNTRKRPQQPWKVRNVIVADDKFWKQAQDLDISSTSAPIAHFPLPRLWQPDCMVRDVLLPLLKDRLAQGNEFQVWDLASGAGRDVAFLAEELLASRAKSQTPVKVVALDHRYNSKETNIVTSFFERRQVAKSTECVQMDLSKWSTLQASLTQNCDVGTFFCVRFWKRSLVEELAKAALPRLTLFAISHFCKPYVGAEWNFEHPSEKTVIERNELRDIFFDGWEVLHDEIAMDSDHGRTMCHFVARRL